MSELNYPFIAFIGNPRDEDRFNQEQLANSEEEAISIARKRMLMGSVREFVIYKPIKVVLQPIKESSPIKIESIDLSKKVNKVFYKNENDLDAGVEVFHKGTQRYRTEPYITGNRYKEQVELYDKDGRFCRTARISDVYSIKD
jgi:hypothetical protein